MAVRGDVLADALMAHPVVEERKLSLADANPSWGLPQLHRQLRQDGHRINRKRSARLDQTHRLSLRRRRRRRLPDRPRQVLVQPVRPNQCWSLDVMSDALVSGRAYRTFNVIDDFARDPLSIAIDFSLASARVIRELDQLCELYDVPEQVRSDNAPELTSHESQEWARQRGIVWEFISPGRPAQNAYVFASTAPTASRSWTHTASRLWPIPAPRPRAGLRSTTSNGSTVPSATRHRRCSSGDDGNGKTRSSLCFQVDALRGYGPFPHLRMHPADELKAAMGFSASYRFDRGSRRDQIQNAWEWRMPPS